MEIKNTMLFTLNKRNDLLSKRSRESTFEFLERSGWNISEFIRTTLNGYAENYKPDREFIKTFKSKSDKQHNSAIFELLVYTALSNSNLTLLRHPETSTGRKPDFEAFDEGIKILIECTLASHSFENLEEKNRKSVVEEIIEEFEYFPYFINLDFEIISKQSISKKRFKNFIELIKIESDSVPDQELMSRYHLYEHEGWQIQVSLFRKRDFTIKQSLGFISDNAKTIDTVKPILIALRDKKGSNYGIDTEPYIIFLNTDDLFTSEDCFSAALFGQEGEITMNDQNTQLQSYFVASNTPINTSVSAVVFFRNFDMFTLDNSYIKVWHNPFAKNKLPIKILPFDEYVFSEFGNVLEKQIIIKKQNIFDILHIDKANYMELKNEINK